MKKRSFLFFVVFLMLILVGCNHEHEYVKEIVSPTCTAQGYTVFTCECGHKYNGEFVNALGHDYSEWTTVKEPTENEKGLLERTCKTCNNKEETQIAELSHAHKYKEEIVPSTCTEQGYTIFICECSDTYKDNYTEIVEHNYVDNVCTYCGDKIQIDCDHQKETYYKVDVRDFGGCFGIFNISKCECGEYTYIQEEEINNIYCLESVDFYDGTIYIDEHGNEQSVVEYTCPDCSLTYIIEWENLKYNPCESVSILSIKKGNEVIVDKATFNHGTMHGNGTIEEIDLSEKISCGGKLWVKTCNVCGEVDEVSMGDYINCQFDVTIESNIPDNFYEEAMYLMGKDDSYYEITIETCKCGLKIVTTDIIYNLGYCKIKDSFTTQMFVGDELIVEYKWDYIDEDHYFEEEHKKVGSTCEEGCYIAETCKYCNWFCEYFADECHHIIDKELNLKDIGVCGGIIYYMECSDCKKTTINHNDMEAECDFEFETTTPVPMEGYTFIYEAIMAHLEVNPEECYVINTYTCNCGLKIKEIITFFLGEGGKPFGVSEWFIYMNDELLFDEII